MAIPLIACGVGLIFSLFPMWLSGFRFVPGDAGDVRFVQLLMEYSYRWLSGHGGGRAFWDFPAFYPVKNTLAYSETLLGVAPLYWFWRVLGLGPDSSYSLWLIVILTLNFWAGYLFLKRGLGFGVLASSVGAYLLAFGSPRIAQLNHPQLAPAFYGVFAAFVLVETFRMRGKTGWAHPALFGAMFVLQFYSGYYSAIFLVIAVVIAAVAGFAIPSLRKQLLAVLKERSLWIPWTLTGLASLLALSPLATHYLAAARTVGVREYWAVEAWLPRIQSWFYLGNSSWLYGWTDPLRVFKILPMAHEQQVGIGLITSVLVLWGLFTAWPGRPAAKVTGCVLVILLLSSTFFPPGFSLWRIWYGLIPGVSAMRSVSRIGIFLLFPAAVGLAFWVEHNAWALRKVSGYLFALFVALVFLEQGRGIPSFDIVGARQTIEAMRERVGRPENSKPCDVFFATVSGGKEAPWKYHIDAMWAAVESGVPTINGYSGNFPADWGNLYDISIRSPEQEAQLRKAVLEWVSKEGIPAANLCNIAVKDTS